MNFFRISSSILALVFLGAAGYFFFLYTQTEQAPLDKNNAAEEQAEQQTQMYSSNEYNRAVALLNKADRSSQELEQAFNLFKSLEASTTMSEDLAHLRLKQLQVLLNQGSYSEAADMLIDIVDTPVFPNVTKARAMENAFMHYLGTGQDRELFVALFSTDQFEGFQAPALRDAWQNYLNFSYDLHPTTITGTHIILNRFNKLDTLSAEERETEVQELVVFLNNYLQNSKEETEHLSTLNNQEIYLVSAYTDRAFVIERAKQLGLEVTVPHDPEDDYKSALQAATDTGLFFYEFYVAYSYINHLYEFEAEQDDRLLKQISEKNLFDPALVSKKDLTVVAGDPTNFSDQKVDYMRNTNASLGELIDQYR